MVFVISLKNSFWHYVVLILLLNLLCNQYKTLYLFRFVKHIYNANLKICYGLWVTIHLFPVMSLNLGNFSAFLSLFWKKVNIWAMAIDNVP